MTTPTIIDPKNALRSMSYLAPGIRRGLFVAVITIQRGDEMPSAVATMERRSDKCERPKIEIGLNHCSGKPGLVETA